MSASRLVTIFCDAEGCGWWDERGMGDTAAEARAGLRGSGWVTTSGGPGGKRFDYCPKHSGATGRNALDRDSGSTTLAFLLTLAALCTVLWLTIPTVPIAVEAMTVGLLRIVGYAVVGCAVVASVAVVCACVRGRA